MVTLARIGPVFAPSPSPSGSLLLEQRLCIAGVLLLAVSPLASFAMCGFLMINLQARTPREVRWVLELALALSLSMMIAAREVDLTSSSEDILVYYDIYVGLAAGDLTGLTQFGGGFEVTLPLLFLLWGWVLPPLSVNGLMFMLALCASLLMVLWVEHTFYRSAGGMRPALAGICLVLLNIYFATQLSRQFFSLVILLFAFSASTRHGRYLALLAAMSLHLTALPFFLLWLLARRGWLGWIAILLIALVLRLYFVPLLTALDIVPAALSDKLTYYLDNEEANTDSDIGSLRMVALLALLSLISLLACRFRPDARTRPWLAVPWLTGVVHFLLLPIPLASLRVTLMVHSVASGVIAWHMFAYRARALLPLILNVLLLYKVLAFGAGQEGANLQPSITMLAGFLA